MRGETSSTSLERVQSPSLNPSTVSVFGQQASAAQTFRVVVVPDRWAGPSYLPPHVLGVRVEAAELFIPQMPRWRLANFWKLAHREQSTYLVRFCCCAASNATLMSPSIAGRQ